MDATWLPFGKARRDARGRRAPSRGRGPRGPFALVLVLAVALVAACGADAPGEPTRFTVYVSGDAPEAVRIAAEDVKSYLARMGREVTLEARTGEVPPCRAGEGTVLLLGDGLGTPELHEGATDQAHRIAIDGCDGHGRRVRLSGGGLLGRQYAAYEWLHALGVRFFHPEEEFVPERPHAIALGDRTIEPAFQHRSVSLHLAHPLELGDVFRAGDERYAEEGVRYVDWQIKNRASFGTDFRGRGYLRGFTRSASIRVWGGQQGGDAVVNPDDPRPETEQVRDAIDAALGAPHDVPVGIFTVDFTPTEFTEMPDRHAVAMLTFIAEHFAAHHPSVRLQAIYQGTHGEPTEHYGVRYRSLAQFAPPNLGVTVHPLMFYDLFRPAPVYGNQDFRYLYDFMEQEHTRRPLWYFPESAWWLTFDIAVPLYLPITLEARDRDIQGIQHMLAGKLDGHRVFGSGHEWGYWQNEYCSFRMAAELDYRWTDCLADITQPMGGAGAEARAVVEAAVAFQERDMFDGELIAYLVGTDQETELGASVGIHHHPLPPAPALVMNWSAEQLARYASAIEPRLQRIEEDYRALVERLNAVEETVDARAKNVFDEIRDGLAMFAIRAEHQRRAYGALVRLRRSQLERAPALADEGEAWRREAEALTEQAREVVHRREGGYRYAPLARSIAGGPKGGEDSNWTTYPYRYLNRTHHVFYYREIDERVAATFRGAAAAMVDDALVGPGELVRVRLLEPALTGVAVDFGDGTVLAPLAPNGTEVTHDYATPGAYVLGVRGELAGNPYALTAPVAELASITRAGYTGAVLQPAGAELIEPVMPGLVFGPLGDGRIAIGFSTTADRRVAPPNWTAANIAAADLLRSEPLAAVEIPVVIRSSETIVARVVVRQMVLAVAETGESASILGDMETDSVVRAAVAATGGAFNETQARTIVASTLGYTAATLPGTVAFEVRYALPAPPPAR